MIKVFLLIIFSFLLVNCSLNENSKIWNNKNKKSDEIKNIKLILEKKNGAPKELNSNLKLNLPKIYSDNNIFDNQNNFGVQNYSGKLNKVSSYKFSKLNEFEQLNFYPLFLDNHLIFFDKKGSVIKYDKNGKILWKRNYYDKFEKKSDPKLSFSKDGNNLIVTDNLSKLYLINLNTGDLIWSKRNDYPFNSEIKTLKNKFFVVDLKNILRCFNIKDGSECWNLKTENSLTVSNSKNSLILDDELVIFNNIVGDITAVDFNTGLIVWQLPTQSSEIINETYNFKHSRLVSDGKNIFFSNNKNEFFSLNKKNGSINWMNTVKSNFTPILVGDLIITISDEGYLYVIDKDKGNIIRINYIFKDNRVKERRFLKPTGFSISQNMVYVSINNGKLKKIELSTGKDIQNINISREIISMPFIFNKNLFVIKNGTVIKYE